MTTSEAAWQSQFRDARLLGPAQGHATSKRS
jgi:hypothetical protein